MSFRAFKGHMGWKGGVGMPPDWIMAIIQFRNDQYDEDGARATKELGPIKGWEAIDEKYEKIDKDISELHKLY